MNSTKEFTPICDHSDMIKIQLKFCQVFVIEEIS
jgi:hypothetical protein